MSMDGHLRAYEDEKYEKQTEELERERKGLVEHLAPDIANYKNQAKELEKEREGLVKRICELMINEVIPEISPLLPEHYTISEESSEVESLPNSSVPKSFCLSLRLHYDNKPIPYGSSQEKGIGNMQHNLWPKLAEISKKYNLGWVMVLGEPHVIG